MNDKVTILGARGSIPVSGPAYNKYGGSTTCVLVKMAGQTILLDAGTGLLNLPEGLLNEPEIDLLLTHLHLDHIQGLLMFRYLLKEHACLNIFTAAAADTGMAADPDTGTAAASACGADRDISVRDQLKRLFSPPLWPVSIDEIPADVRFINIARAAGTKIGSVSVTAMSGNHPGGVTLYRLEAYGKSVVLATDCTFTEGQIDRIAAFAAGCDLLLCDGQYDETEWESSSGFGHSTWEMAARLGKRCNAGNVRIMHHSPAHTDDYLDRAEIRLKNIYPACSFAREGEEIRL